MESRKNILIVDDDRELATLLAQAVADASDSYDVKVAQDVDGAMVLVHKAQTAQRPFDLVITDIKMIGLSGLELLEALESIAPGTKTITMTAYNSPELAQRSQELNAFAHLTKPFIISHLRQIVREALSIGAPPGDEGEEEEPPLRLSEAQKTATEKQLATLRAMTGSTAALLLHARGTVLATDSITPDFSPDDLGKALMTTQQTVAQRIGQAFDQDAALDQSYFGTDTFSVCTYRLDDSHFIATVFGPAVKEGQIWYYMREAVQNMQGVLTGDLGAPAAGRARRRGDVFGMLDRFFPERQQVPPEEQRTRPTEAAPARERLAGRGTPETEASIPAPPVMAAPPEERVPTPVVDRAAIEDIDWDIPISMEWDQLVAGTDQGFRGLTLEEAQEQGLVAQESVSSSGQEEEATAATQPSDRPSLDEIDWDVSVDTDWDQLVAHTDQGFGGLSFEDAKHQGLVDDVQDS